MSLAVIVSKIQKHDPTLHCKLCLRQCALKTKCKQVHAPNWLKCSHDVSDAEMKKEAPSCILTELSVCAKKQS